MHILQVASEFTPLAREGYVGDNVAGLSRALAQNGHRVSVMLPAYRSIMESGQLSGLEQVFEHSIEMGSRFETANIYPASWRHGIDLYLVGRDEYFDRKYPYGTSKRDYDDNDARFIFFAKAVADTICCCNLHADILHCHDWPAALVPLFTRASEERDGLYLVGKTVFTIHNLAYQGIFSRRVFGLTNLPDELNGPAGLEFYNQINFLKGGMVFSDHLTIVSKRYRDEALTSEFGCGLRDVLRTRDESLTGITNGIDAPSWDPRTDPCLPDTFSSTNLAGRQACREALLERAGLDVDTPGPIFAIEDALPDDQYLDIINGIDEYFQKHPGTLIGLEKEQKRPTGKDHALSEANTELEVPIRIITQKEDRRLLFAGADFLLIFTDNEPCSLAVMEAQSYGCLPIAPRFSGFLDTINDLRDSPASGTGILYDLTEESLLEILTAANDACADTEVLENARIRALRQDFSWDKPAAEYEKLFRELAY